MNSVCMLSTKVLIMLYDMPACTAFGGPFPGIEPGIIFRWIRGVEIQLLFIEKKDE